MLRAGDFFVGPYPPGSAKKRRFITLTDEEADGTVVWAYLSTTTSDHTTALAPGEHPEVTDRCHVVYGQSRIVQAGAIRQAVADGALAPAVRLSAVVLARIHEGIFESDETPVSVIDYCKDLI